MPTWKLHFKSGPSDVYRALSTPGGRSRYWADAPETDGTIHFAFPAGHTTDARIEEAIQDRRYRFTWYTDRTLTFDLIPDDAGGTDLTVTSSTGPHLAGDISVLLRLKAWVDFGVDLRNHDDTRSAGYLDS
ncbi:SRPBCC domain-containing protein [Kribbella sp. NPDC051587]|uniref:SRPBCC domain-containing protein n=1 Tax=Kribbella sp. NPDC051587 TaxID=3364119 RepID=UPI0037990D53